MTTLKGLVHVTGPVGVGKTTFAITAAPPSRVLCLDWERSAAVFSEVHQYPIVWLDVLGTFQSKHPEITEAWYLELYEHWHRILEDIPPRKYDVVVIDNIRYLGDAYEAYVRANHTKFGISSGQLQTMQALVWGPIRNLFRLDMHMLQAGRSIGLVIVTSHLQDDWSAGRPLPGVQKPQGFRMTSEIATLALWLRPQAGSRVPYAIVLKDRTGRIEWVESKEKAPDYLKPVIADMPPDSFPRAVVRPCLPRRLPEATWASIAYYLQHPADWQNPAPGEVLSEQELHILRGTLPEEARDALRLARLEAERQQAREEAAAAVPPTTVAELLARAMKELKPPVTEIFTRLGVTSPNEIHDPAVAWQKLRSG